MTDEAKPYTKDDLGEHWGGRLERPRVLATVRALDAAKAELEGALSLRAMQKRLPWTIPYSKEFVSSGEPHRNLMHDVMHVMKSLGRIAALAEDFDHGRPPRMTREQLAKELADLPICALHMASHNPLGHVDLHSAVVEHSELRNGTPGALKGGGK